MKKRYFAMLLLLLLSAFVLVACGIKRPDRDKDAGDKDNTDMGASRPYFTVEWYDGVENDTYILIKEINGKYTHKALDLTNATREGYYFKGIFTHKNGTGTMVFDKTGEVLTDDIQPKSVFYAHFEPIEIYVCYDISTIYNATFPDGSKVKTTTIPFGGQLPANCPEFLFDDGQVKCWRSMSPVHFDTPIVGTTAVSDGSVMYPHALDSTKYEATRLVLEGYDIHIIALRPVIDYVNVAVTLDYGDGRKTIIDHDGYFEGLPNGDSLYGWDLEDILSVATKRETALLKSMQTPEPSIKDYQSEEQYRQALKEYYNTAHYTRELLGWAYSPYETTNFVTGGELTENVTLYAIYRDCRTVLLHNIADEPVKKYVYKNEPLLLRNPTFGEGREGYNFYGWYTDALHTNTASRVITYDGDVTSYYAKAYPASVGYTIETVGLRDGKTYQYSYTVPGDENGNYVADLEYETAREGHKFLGIYRYPEIDPFSSLIFDEAGKLQLSSITNGAVYYAIYEVTEIEITGWNSGKSYTYVIPKDKNGAFTGRIDVTPYLPSEEESPFVTFTGLWDEKNHKQVIDKFGFVTGRVELTHGMELRAHYDYTAINVVVTLDDETCNFERVPNGASTKTYVTRYGSKLSTVENVWRYQGIDSNVGIEKYDYVRIYRLLLLLDGKDDTEGTVAWTTAGWQISSTVTKDLLHYDEESGKYFIYMRALTMKGG